MPPLFALLLHFFALFSIGSCFHFDECNVTRSCWFHPPQCNAENRGVCVSGVEWNVESDGIIFELFGQVRDLDPTSSHYISVGFSFNQKMDDDTVIDCIRRPQGDGRIQLSFNDNKHNKVLSQASTVLLQNTMITFSDGMMNCTGKLLFDTSAVEGEEQWMVHDLQSQPFYLLFARGTADVFSWQKDIHSTNDGALFPWTSGASVSFCALPNCTNPAELLWIRDMKQTDMERYWRYRIAVLHGAILLLAWWVLGSSAILIARYFKPLFPTHKLLGTSVWFQLHRDFNIVSIILQIIAVLGIFWQSGWVWYECSYECTNDDFALKMHAITGVTATALACVQPFLAILRPSPDSSARPIFNWAHTIVGMTAWTFSSATFVLSLPLGKTGLNREWGHVPNYIMGGYIITFVVTNLLLEMISTGGRINSNRIATSGLSLNAMHGPSKEYLIDYPKRTRARVFIFFVHLIISLGVSIAITVMLVKTLLSHSP